MRIIPFEVLEAVSCVDNSEGKERACGSAVTRLFGFSLFALLSSIGIVGLYYLFKRD